MGKAIGIDLGTTNSVVAFKDTVVRTIQTGANNEDLCRSCVALDNNGNFIVGNSAYASWKRYAPNIVVSVKRLMGAAFSDEQVQKMRADKQAYPYGIVKPSNGTEEAVSILLRGQEYTPEKISAEILKSLKNDASNKLGEVTHAVITVPAYFTEKQRSATKKAAEMAGICVQQLIAEPTAAAIAYGVTELKEGESKIVLVYDFGGGTFDLSVLTILNGQVIESGAGGDRWLGGDDIDRKLIDYVCKAVEQRDGFVLSELLDNKTDREKAAFTAGLKKDIEDAKKMLGRNASATIGLSDYLETDDGDPVDDFTISQEKFESLIRPLIARTIQLIDELLIKTGTPMEAIDNILLVGGSSCIPLVKSMLCDKYGVDKILSSEKPMLTVAEGAAILAQSLPCEDGPIALEDQTGELNNERIVVTTKHEYFIQLIDGDGNLKMEKIINHGEVLQHDCSRQFHTSIPNQKIVEVKLYTDTENNQYSKLTSGFFTIKDNLPAGSALNFTFKLDQDETLTSTVMVVDSGKTHDIRLARGFSDSSCLREISSAIEEVFSNSNISVEKKTDFVEKVQQIIENIEANHYDSDSEEWNKLEEQVKMAKAVAQMNENEGENRLGEILATILLQNFSYCLNEFDKDAMKNKLNQLHSNNDVIQKNSLIQELENIATKYSLLLHVFMFKIIAQQTNDPIVAGRATCVYDEMQEALQSGNVAQAKYLLQNNEDLLDSSQNGGTEIKFRTDIV
jgi:molecular chaperone DnaK